MHGLPWEGEIQVIFMGFTLSTNEKFTEVGGTAVINHTVFTIRVCKVNGFLKGTGFLLCALRKHCFPMEEKKKDKQGLQALWTLECIRQH